MNENTRQFFVFLDETGIVSVPQILIEKKTFVYVLVIALLMVPLVLKKELNNLRFFALFGFGTICYISLVIVVCAFMPNINEFSDNSSKIEYFRPMGTFSTFPLFIFSFTCQQNVLNAFQELNAANPRRMKKVITRQLFLCSVLYCFVGIFGYLTFPDD